MVAGTADCSAGGGNGWSDLDLTGDVEGTIDSDQLELVWWLDFQWGDPVEVPGKGTRDGDLLTLEFSADINWYGEFAAEAEAERQ
ncbi:MAG: hypothetical protein EXR71_18095 [Myxococcales bacterium]|nr:hypothetical protein [Myxococcales bacterium]